MSILCVLGGRQGLDHRRHGSDGRCLREGWLQFIVGERVSIYSVAFCQDVSHRECTVEMSYSVCAYARHRQDPLSWQGLISQRFDQTLWQAHKDWDKKHAAAKEKKATWFEHEVWPKHLYVILFDSAVNVKHKLPALLLGLAGTACCFLPSFARIWCPKRHVEGWFLDKTKMYMCCFPACFFHFIEDLAAGGGMLACVCFVRMRLNYQNQLCRRQSETVRKCESSKIWAETTRQRPAFMTTFPVLSPVFDLFTQMYVAARDVHVQFDKHTPCTCTKPCPFAFILCVQQ